MPVPNIEMITAGIFIAGVWMGPRLGIFIGIVAEAIFSLLNPMGFPPPPLLLSQIIAMSLTGCVGGLFRKMLIERQFFSIKSWTTHALLGLAGFLLTSIYDFLTNISFPLAAGFDLEQIRITLVMGLPFAITHIGVNTVIFILVVPAFLQRVKAWRSL